LSPDGWLFLGASDPQLSELTECQVVVTGAGVAYRRGDASALASEDFGIFSAVSAEVSWPSPPKLVEARSSGVTMPVVETRSASRFEHKVEPNAASSSKRTAESL